MEESKQGRVSDYSVPGGTLLRLFDFDSHRPVRWVNLTDRLPEPPHKAPFLTHFAAGGGEVGEKGKRERGSWL